MPAAQTSIINALNEVYTPLAITTTEQEWAFDVPTGQGSPRRTVQLVGDVAWLFSHQAGGPYFPVPAGVPFQLQTLANSTSAFVKTASGTGTLSAVCAER